MKNHFLSVPKALVAGFIFLISTSATNPGHADYSGDWKIDALKSYFGKFGERSAPVEIYVAQKEDTISIERISKNSKGQLHGYTEKLPFNGNPVFITIGDATKKTTSIKWNEGKTILTEIASYKDDSAPEQYAESKGTEIWVLSEDGKTLEITRSDVMRDETVASKIIYHK